MTTDLEHRISLWSDPLRDVGIDHAGLYNYVFVGDVDFEDAGHAGQADDYTAWSGQRASAQAGSGAAADKRDFVTRAHADYSLHLRGTAREHYCAGHNAEVRQPVALIGLQLTLASDESVVADSGAQFFDVLVGKHGRRQLTRFRVRLASLSQNPIFFPSEWVLGKAQKGVGVSTPEAVKFWYKLCTVARRNTPISTGDHHHSRALLQGAE